MNFNRDFKEPYDFLLHNLTIGDFSDLSIVEILTLYFLQRHNEPLVRHSLYVEVKNYLKSERLVCESEFLNEFSEIELRFFEFLKKKKKLSASSFYNSLIKLEQKGLIKYIKDQKDKVVLIEPSKLTIPALNFLNQYIMLMMMDDFNFQITFGEKIKAKIHPSKFDNLLIISFGNHLELNLLKFFKEQSNKTYILAKPLILDRLGSIDIGTFDISEINDDMIREPNNIFDSVVILDYCKNPNFFGLSRKDIIKECNRVVNEGGFLIIVGRTKAESNKNFYVNKLLEYYNYLFHKRGQIFSKKELLNDFQVINSKNVDIIEEQGLIIGILSI